MTGAHPGGHWPEALSDVVRVQVVMAQLAAHLPGGGIRAVDLGAGAGHLAVALAVAGHDVTAVDPDHAIVTLLERRRARLDPAAGARLRVLRGRAEDGPAGTADLVCCHAVLPVVDDPARLIAATVAHARPGGLVSVVAKNGDALPLRAGLSGDFATAVALADGAEERDSSGRVLAAHGVDDVIAMVEAAGASVEAWYGLQVVTPHRNDVVDPRVAAAAVALESRLGQRDPLRRAARLVHVVARRSSPTPDRSEVDEPDPGGIVVAADTL